MLSISSCSLLHVDDAVHSVCALLQHCIDTFPSSHGALLSHAISPMQVSVTYMTRCTAMAHAAGRLERQPAMCRLAAG